ncbi:uncharacterized protein LOC135367500 [Ornithodoros turicata]|uniref:uncharacterized protein LOC135367500 n=1 Tax=Ornithodoros turicata TaxID=34597 RepID=UPI003138FE50
MAGLPKALPATTPPLQLSIYADNICLWTNGKDPWKVMKTIQKGVDATTEYIRGLGLTPSAEKTRVMLLGSTANWCTLPEPILMENTPLEQVRVHRFLGVTLDSRSSWAPLVKDLQTRCKTTLNVTMRLSGRHSGFPQRTLLTIHNATTAARMLFGLPYAKPSRSALESLELLHRRGLKLALGLPPGARNVALYAEAAALPLQLRATQHLLNQLTRLNRTTTGRATSCSSPSHQFPVQMLHGGSSGPPSGQHCQACRGKRTFRMRWHGSWPPCAFMRATRTTCTCTRTPQSTLDDAPAPWPATSQQHSSPGPKDCPDSSPPRMQNSWRSRKPWTSSPRRAPPKRLSSRTPARLCRG